MTYQIVDTSKEKMDGVITRFKENLTTIRTVWK